MNLMEKWKKFFTDAGVPASDAATYAYKFAHNRIQTDMLTELNKDYLKEMGITIMGDVIAILRHSKHVYEELQKSGKTELQDEVSKEPRKDKEVTSRNQKSHIESNATKKESKVITKSVSNNTSQKRKLEPTSAPSKKMTKEPPKKIPHPILNSDNIEECEDLGYVMIDTSKKASISQKLSNVEKQLKTAAVNKKEEKLANRLEDIFNMSEDDDEDDDNVEVIINDPILTPFGGYKRYPMQEKYDIPYTKNKDTSKLANPQLDTGKRTVFKRLGDDISQHSVTSTTAFEDEEQQIMNAKKFKDDSSKLPQEKNSVFHRLGQKCDVSSTSADANEKFLDEDKKVDIKLDPIEAKKSNQLRKLPVKRKVKPKEESNAPPSTFTIKPTYTEGILAANSRKEHKPSLKERLGIPKSKDLNLRTMSAEVEYIGEIKMRRSYPPEDFYKKTRLVSTSSRKKVSFGSVSEKLIPSREEAIKNGELSLASERVSVFDRLGFNRTL